MKRLLTLILALLPFVVMAQVEVSSLRVNGLDKPMGVSPDAPLSFSWISTSAEKSASQSAYEISVYKGVARVWYSGVVQSENSISVPYGGKLLPDAHYSWVVRVWDNKGRVSKAMKSTWQTGLGVEDWQGEMIGEVDKLRPLNLDVRLRSTKRLNAPPPILPHTESMRPI